MKISNLVAILLLIIASSLHVTVQQQLQLDCSAKLDIFFLLDASDSLSDADFEKEKKLVIDLLQRLIDDSRDAKAGYLTFTESVNNVRTLLSNLHIVQFELANVIFDQEGTNLLVPLDYAYNNIFTSNPDLRPGSQRILFQITDGRDQFSNISQLSSTSKLLSAENVTTVAIGVGNLIDTDQLRAIATEPHEQNLIVFSDLNEAIGNVSNIIDRTCTIPRVIAISAVVQSSTSITVKWMSYTIDTVGSYKICLKTEIEPGENCIHDINSTLTELLVENLIPNTRYEISVFAFTSIGVTPMSNILVATTTETPGTPLLLNATSLTSTSIKVTWQAAAGSNVTSYEICASLSSGGNCVFEATIGAAVTSLEYTQGNLEPNTTYYFRIRGISSGGIGEYSIESNATTALLGSPNLLSAVESSFHAIILTWSAYTEASLSSFEICVKLEGSTGCYQTFTAQGTATSYTVILLEAYTLYEVSLVAIKGSIRSAESDSITVRTGEKRPGDPTNVSAVALSPVEIEITWSSPASDELHGVIQAYYICVREETGESCLFLINHNASISPFTVTLSGLTPDTVYRVRVRAINGGGAGSYSDDYSITTESVSAVTVSTSTINSDSITITWTGGNIPATEITGAVITITTVSTGAVQTINLGQADAVNGSYQVVQLQPGAQYTITVVVITTAGDTPLSNETSVQTQESLPTGAPIVTSTGGQTSTSITLTLDSIPMLQRNGVILFYIVYYKADGDTSYSSVVVPVTDQSANVTYTLEGLSPNTAYTIQVSGNNSVGEGPRTQSVSITTTVSGAVQNLTSTSTSSRNITVSYLAYTEIGLIEYRACIRSTSQGACIQTQNTTGLVFYFAGLEPAQTYYITVTAVTQFGDSEESQALNVTTDEEIPGPPNSLNVSRLSVESISITWTEISTDQQYGIIIEYIVCIKEVGSANCTFMQTVDANSQPFSLNQTGLMPNTNYIITVQGRNSAGLGDTVDTTVQTEPLQGVILSAQAVDGHSIRLTWTVPNVPVSLITGGILTSVGSPSDFGPSFNIGLQNVLSRDFIAEGFYPATTYYFTLKIITALGITPVSNEASTTTNETEPNGIPSNFSAETISASSIKVIWTPVSPQLTNGVITMYTICFGTEIVTCAEVSVNASPPLEYTFTDLEPETEYLFRIRAHTAVGAGPYTDSINQTTSKPGGFLIHTITAASATTVDITWNQLNVSVSYYEICVLINQTESCSNPIQINNGTQTSYTIVNLLPYTMYYVTISAMTPGGYVISSPQRSIRTQQQAPSSSPTNVTVTVSDTTIIIYFGTVAEGDTNGVITVYEVCVQTVSGGPCVFTANVTATETRVNITGLTDYTNYIVTVRAHTSAGPGPYSPEVAITTLHSLPEEAVINVTVQSGPTVIINGSIPQTGGPTTGVQVCIRLPSTTECVSIIVVNTTGTSFNTTIEDLDPNQTYEVIVIVTGPGGNTTTGPVTITTQPEPPSSSPTNVTVTVSDTTITIYFGTVAEGDTNGVITVYEVCVQTVSGGPCVFTANVTATETRVNITGLTDNTNYIVTVRAHTSAGPGPYSPEVAITTLHSLPEEAVINVTVQSGPTVIINGSIPQTGGPTTGVQVCIRLPSTTECVSIIVVNTTGTSFNTTIEDLDPNQTYEVIVIVTGPGGNTTTGPVTITTQPEPPSSPPTNVTIIVDSDTTITIFFGTVAEGDTNGVITVYEVCVQTVSGGPCVFTANVTATETRVNITGLTDYTNYIVTVRAHTSAGPGPYSPEVAITTLHSLPEEAVINVTVQSGPTVIINGSIPQTGGPTTGVQVCIRLPSTTECVSIIVVNTTGTSFNTTIEDLDPNQTYEVIVIVTGPGGNTTTGPVTITTQPEPPSSSPTNVTVTVSDTTITIYFGTVAEGDTNGVITVYEVCVQTVSGGPCVFTANVTATEIRVNITGLTDYTNYIVTVRAHTSAGPGPYSPEVAITTLHSLPEEAVINVTVQSGPTVIINGSIPQTGGPTTGVQVCIRLPSTTECVSIIVVNTTGTSFNTTIEDLDPNQTYEVIVIVTGPGGNTTTGPVTITTQPELPSGTVQNIQTSSDTTVFGINWTQPVAINDVTVTYYVTISTGGVILNITQTSNESIVFTGLNPNTEYEIVVTPSNSVGNGTGTTVIVRTQQEQPEPLQIVSVLTNSVQIMLTPVATTNTTIQIKHYEVCIQQSSSDTCDRTLIITPTENFTFTIQNLNANTLYRIMVFAITINDERGPPSDVVTFETFPLVPTEGVTNLDAVINNLFSLEVSWDFNATSQEHEPSHFSVCLALQSGGNCTITRNVTADINSVVIPEVEEETMYYITVYPWNVNGAGPTAVTNFTVPEKSGPAVTITATALSPYEIYFEWEFHVILLNTSSFTICISIKGSSVCTQTRYGQPVSSGELIFSGLTPNTSYTIHIVELISRTSDAITEARTPINGISDSPLNVLVTTISSTVLRVTWVPSRQTKFGNLTSWEICYTAERFNETSGCTSSQKDQLYKSILKLEEHETYSITVRAVYTNGNGTAFSVPVTGKTEQDVPSRTISGLVGVTEVGESKFIWLAPPIKDQNGIIVYYLVVFEYEDDDGFKNISIREDPIMRETNIPYLVTVPYNISVTPYTIGAGPPYKIIGAVQEPVAGEALCPDWRISVTILCVVLAVLIVMAIAMCSIILILIVSKNKTSTYSAV